MAGRSDIEAGKAYVRLYVKQSELIKGLSAIKQTLAAIGDSVASLGIKMASIGTAVGGGLVAAAGRFAVVGDSITKMSQRTGIGTNALSELGYAAEQSGATIDDLEAGIRKMQKTISAAAGGSKEAKDALRQLGITADMLKEPPDAQIELFADRLNQIRDPALRAATVMKIFGKSGTSLIPLFAEGADGIRALRKEAEELGLSIDPADAQAATRLGDAWDRVKKTTGAAAFQVGAALAPALESIADTVRNTIGGFADWIKNNREIVVTSAKVAAAIVASGASMFVFGKALKVGAAAIGVFQTITAPAAFVVGVLRNRVLSIGTAFTTAAKSVAAGSVQISKSIAGGITRAGATIASASVLGSKIGLAVAGGINSTSSMISAASMRVANTAASAMGRAAGSVAGIVPSFAAIRGAIPKVEQAISRVGPSIRSAMAQAQLAVNAFKVGFAQNIYLETDKTSQAFWQMGSRIQSAWKFAINPSSWKASVSSLVGTVSSGVASIRNYLTDPLRAPIQWRSLMANAFQSTVKAARVAASAIATAWRAVGPRMAAGVVSAMRGAFTRVSAMGRAAAVGITRGVGRGIGGGLGAVGGVVTALGGLVGGGILSSLAQVIPVVGMLGASVAGLLNPFTLIVGAIGLGVAAWFKFSDSGKEAFGKIAEVVMPFVDIFKQAWAGISNAIAVGDLRGAIRIALAGAKVAMLEGLSQIQAATAGSGSEIVTTFTGTLSTIGAKIAQGDMAGAWNTAVLGMGSAWDGLASGIVSAMASSVKKVMAIWKGAVDSIANWMLDMAATDTVAGRAFSAMLGVDVKDEKQRGALLEEQRKRQVAKQLQWGIDQNEQAAKEMDATGDTKGAERKRMAASSLKADLAKIEGGPMFDPMAAARDSVDKSTASVVDTVNGAMTAMADTAKAKAKQSGDALEMDIVGGASMAQQALDDARAEFDMLTSDAAAKADAKKAADVQKTDEPPPGDGTTREQLAASSKAASATFSAAALSQANRGTGGEKTVAELKALRKDNDKTNKEIIIGLARLDRSIRLGTPRFGV